jgi:hypothetical protein
MDERSRRFTDREVALASRHGAHGSVGAAPSGSESASD